MDRRSVSLLGSMVGVIAGAFGGLSGSMKGAAAEMAAAAPVLRASRGKNYGIRMTRRSTLSPRQRYYLYEPFTPAAMATYYKGEPSRQVKRQHERRLAKVVRQRLKLEARSA